jgi:hypothetical protein
MATTPKPIRTLSIVRLFKATTGAVVLAAAGLSS